MSAPYPPAIADLLLRKREQGCTAELRLFTVPDGWLLAPAPAGTEGVQPQLIGSGRAALVCAVYLCQLLGATPAVQQGAPL